MMGYLKNIKNKIKSFNESLVDKYGGLKEYIGILVLIISIFVVFLFLVVSISYKLSYTSIIGVLIALLGLITSLYFTHKHGKEYSSYIREFRGYMADLDELLKEAGKLIEGAEKSIKIVTVWLGCGSVLAKVGHAAYIGSLYKKAAEEKVKKEYLFSISLEFKREFEKANKVSGGLENEFEKNTCRLSKNATISRVNKNEWEISDGKKECTIIESGNLLNIYKKGEFEITVITLPPEIARKRTEEEFPISNERKPGFINEIVENDKTIGRIMKKLRIKIKYHDRVQFHVFIVDDKKALFYMEEPVKEKKEAVKKENKIVGYVTEDPRMVDVLIEMFKRMDEESKPCEWVYLFCMKVDYAKYLEDGKVNDKVEKEFKDCEQLLSGEAKVSTIDENHWRIVDGKKGYRIENTGTLLKIYRE